MGGRSFPFLSVQIVVIPRRGKEGFMDEERALLGVQSIIQYSFKDLALLKAALTPGPATNNPPGNNSLEWLGDGLLKGAVFALAFAEAPGLNGRLLRDFINEHQSNQVLTSIGDAAGIRPLLHRYPSVGWKTIADVLESIVGASWLDGGNVAVKEVIHTLFASRLDPFLVRRPNRTRETLESLGSALVQSELTKIAYLDSPTLPPKTLAKRRNRLGFHGYANFKRKRLKDQRALSFTEPGYERLRVSRKYNPNEFLAQVWLEDGEEIFALRVGELFPSCFLNQKLPAHNPR